MKKERIIPSPFWSYILLVTIAMTVFLVTIFPPLWHAYFYKSLFMVIYFTAIYNMDKYRTRVLLCSLLVLVMNGVSIFLDLPVIGIISKVLNIIFFIYIVGALISQVASAKTVNATVILDSINGYLLMGLTFAILVAVIGEFDPASFNFHDAPDENLLPISHFSKDLYFTFITMATVGFGDMLPVKPFARSLTTLIGVTGQLYIAIIIAMLVGKFASQTKD